MQQQQHKAGATAADATEPMRRIVRAMLRTTSVVARSLAGLILAQSGRPFVIINHRNESN